MRVLITSFVVLFGLAQFSQWLEHSTLQLPMLILGGALLAIASNYGKSPGWFFSQQQTQVEGNQIQAQTLDSSSSTTNWSKLHPAPPTSVSPPPRSISFTIHKQPTTNNK